MVSVCLPSDALSQCLPSYLGFSYLGHGVSLHGCSSKAQPLLLTLDVGYVLSATPAPAATTPVGQISRFLFPLVFNLTSVWFPKGGDLNHSRGLPATFCRDNGVQGKSKKQSEEHKLLTSCPCIPSLFLSLKTLHSTYLHSMRLHYNFVSMR